VYLDDVLHSAFEPEDLEFLLGTPAFSRALHGALRASPCERRYAELCALGNRLLMGRGRARLQDPALMTVVE
jgi:hypothetical protein